MDPDVTVDDLTPRQRQVVVLIGGRRLSYKAAARLLTHRYHEGAHVSPGTVRQYANDIRHRIQSPLPPRDALTVFYGANKDRLDEVA